MVLQRASTVVPDCLSSHSRQKPTSVVPARQAGEHLPAPAYGASPTRPAVPVTSMRWSGPISPRLRRQTPDRSLAATPDRRPSSASLARGTPGFPGRATLPGRARGDPPPPPDRAPRTWLGPTPNELSGSRRTSARASQRCLGDHRAPARHGWPGPMRTDLWRRLLLDHRHRAARDRGLGGSVDRGRRVDNIALDGLGPF